ncbi:MAG: LPS-assembly protein LptD, partial [Phycisphaerae bacterium]|nr:LPS-assembly protein LptD [Phycisphaerae bacterium]
MLKKIPLLLCGCLLGLVWLGTAGAAQGQLGQEVTAEGGPSQRAELTLSGEGLAIWSEPDGTQLLVYKGNFSAKGPEQSLSSDRAVIWLKQVRQEGQIHSSLRVYLEGKVEIRESSGAVTTDEVLLSRLEVAGPLAIEAVERTDEPQRDDPLYQRAVEALQESSIAEPIEEGITGQRKQKRVEEDERAKRREGERVGPIKLPRGPVFMRGSIATVQKGNERIITLVADERGQVYVSQAATKSKLLLEMQADAAVVFQDLDSPEEDEQTGGTFTGVYLEGHVLVRQGDRTIRAKRVYYDLQRQRALILDGVLRTIERQRRVPLYLRAGEIRQLSEKEFAAKKATLTSSDFERPDFHMGASRVQLRQHRKVDKQGREVGEERLHVRADNITINIGGLPIFWWPIFVGDLGEGEVPIQSVKFGENKSDGVIVETDWWLFRLLGLETPENVRAILGLDYMSKRGPVVRYEIDYRRDKYEGYLRGYLIDDHGEDQLSRTREDIEPLTNLRGRALLRHRHYLPRDWEMQLEASYISDANWLEQFEEREFDTGKDQETALYLKKQRQNWAFSMLANTRLMDFISLTEHL